MPKINSLSSENFWTFAECEQFKFREVRFTHRRERDDRRHGTIVAMDVSLGASFFNSCELYSEAKLLRALFRGKVEQLVRLSYDAFSTRGAAQTLKCLGHADYFFDDNRQNGIKTSLAPCVA